VEIDVGFLLADYVNDVAFKDGTDKNPDFDSAP